MCDHANREAAMVTLYRDETGTPTVWCDSCIAPLVKALNEAGLTTTASCCGHNGRGSDGEQSNAPAWIMLRDGRTLTVSCHAPEPTMTFPAHHIVGTDLGFTCTNCGGHTSITPPCIPARDYPLANPSAAQGEAEVAYFVSAGVERALTEAARIGQDINIAGALYRKINHGARADSLGTDADGSGR